MKIKSHIAILFLLSLFLANCSYFGKKIDYGEVKDDVYSNAFFNFSMNIPNGWVLSKELMDEINKTVFVDDNKEMNVLNKNTTYLLTVFLSEFIPENNTFNPCLEIAAINLKAVPKLKTELEAIPNSQTVIPKAEFYDYVVFDRETINGIEFYLRETVAGSIQKCYVIILNDFALCFSISFADKEQEDILMQSIKSIKFN